MYNYKAVLPYCASVMVPIFLFTKQFNLFLSYLIFQDKSAPKVHVNDYIQIYGNIKTNKGKKVLMAFKIMPVTDVNAITFHYLQCINNKVKMEADSKKVKLPTGINLFL